MQVTDPVHLFFRDKRQQGRQCISAGGRNYPFRNNSLFAVGCRIGSHPFVCTRADCDVSGRQCDMGRGDRLGHRPGQFVQPSGGGKYFLAGEAVAIRFRLLGFRDGSADEASILLF